MQELFFQATIFDQAAELNSLSNKKPHK